VTHSSQSPGPQWQGGGSVKLVRVSKGSEIAVTVTGLVHAYQMHWIPTLARTQPCLLVSCPHCREGSPRRPLSYAPIMHWRMYGEAYQWLPAILEVPHSTGITLGGLVGQIVHLKRERHFGPVLVGKFSFAKKPPTMVKLNVLDHLMPLWRIDRNTALVLVGQCDRSTNEQDFIAEATDHAYNGRRVSPD